MTTENFDVRKVLADLPEVIEQLHGPKHRGTTDKLINFILANQRIRREDISGKYILSGDRGHVIVGYVFPKKVYIGVVTSLESGINNGKQILAVNILTKSGKSEPEMIYFSEKNKTGFRWYVLGPKKPDAT